MFPALVLSRLAVLAARSGKRWHREVAWLCPERSDNETAVVGRHSATVLAGAFTQTFLSWALALRRRNFPDLRIQGWRALGVDARTRSLSSVSLEPDGSVGQSP
ncbi:unnamed protein product [Effrenium voratum]|nr:unnamed protein product [Effrenium voratum]